ncbi:serine hydrolase domain-containing protein [Sphingoaurantiacus capsulatus]|uniref:Serine hydrolase domain-containing protein n=1 Tax=Sphingoaurantiacus capsulatus TaxID=1771310 RepID=A0ABV7X6X6_9SPHN
MFRSLLAALVGLLMTAAPAAADDFAAFDAFLAQFRKEKRIPAMTAVIVKDGRIAWQAAYGTSDDEGEIATTMDTVFWIASVSKPISAAAVLAEVDAGRLSIDTPMTADPRWHAQCEWMRGTDIPFGGGDKDAGGEIPPVNCERKWTLRDLLSMRVNGDGSRFVYNPIAYARLSRIVTGSGGRELRDIVRDNILKPAGIDHTALGWQDEKGGLALARMAPPFKMTDDGPRKTVFPDDDFRGAAGVYTSAANLAKFDIALDAGKLLSPARTAQLLGRTPQRDGYDWGWFRQDWQGQRLVWHSGWEPDAYSAMYLKVPDKRLTLIVLANTEGLWWGNSLVRAEIENSLVAKRFLESFAR